MSAVTPGIIDYAVTGRSNRIELMRQQSEGRTTAALASHALHLQAAAVPAGTVASPAMTSGKSFDAFRTSYAAAGGAKNVDPVMDARRKGLQRRASASMLGMDQGFNSFRGAISAGWRTELFSWRFRQAVMAEIVSSAIFVAIGTLSVIFTHTVRNPSAQAVVMGSGGLGLLAGELDYPIPRWTGISFVFGLLICVLVFATGAISGANINPAVTVSLCVTGKMSVLRAIFYIIAQCAGACAGAAFARSLSPELFDLAGGAANMINHSKPWVSLWTALGGEILGTGLLVFTVCAAADVGRERSNKYVGALTPPMIGFAVLNVHLFLIPIDGCSINPARSLGSAVLYGTASGHPEVWNEHWVFWAGPMIGGPAAALLYEFIFSTNSDNHAVAAPSTAAIDVSKGPGINIDAINASGASGAVGGGSSSSAAAGTHLSIGSAHLLHNARSAAAMGVADYHAVPAASSTTTSAMTSPALGPISGGTGTLQQYAKYQQAAYAPSSAASGYDGYDDEHDGADADGGYHDDVSSSVMGDGEGGIPDSASELSSMTGHPGMPQQHVQHHHQHQHHHQQYMQHQGNGSVMPPPLPARSGPGGAGANVMSIGPLQQPSASTTSTTAVMLAQARAHLQANQHQAAAMGQGRPTMPVALSPVPEASLPQHYASGHSVSPPYSYQHQQQVGMGSAGGLLRRDSDAPSPVHQLSSSAGGHNSGSVGGGGGTILARVRALSNAQAAVAASGGRAAISPLPIGREGSGYNMVGAGSGYGGAGGNPFAVPSGQADGAGSRRGTVSE